MLPLLLCIHSLLNGMMTFSIHVHTHTHIDQSVIGHDVRQLAEGIKFMIEYRHL